MMTLATHLIVVQQNTVNLMKGEEATHTDSFIELERGNLLC